MKIDGVTYLLAPDVRGWIDPDQGVRVEFHEGWGGFRVDLVGQAAC